MGRYFLAVDIGASSGRHILFELENGIMRQEEIYRFPNGNVRKDNHLTWDVDSLFGHILAGMKECGRRGITPVSVGVDTWGVDFVLLDGNGQRLGDAVAYRDSRTEGADAYVKQFIPEDELYARTGIQKQKFNTIYQLAAVKNQEAELLAKADKLLMMPDYFHYLLSGKAATEYTNATTGQLVSPVTFDWDYDLIRRLGYPEKIFQTIVPPGTVLGDLKPEIAEEVGFTCKVVAPGTHDTASAVLAVPSASDAPLYISSGTWSLMGTELHEANCSPQAGEANFTNEGGYDRRFRFLKNIMGLWMIQSIRRELNGVEYVAGKTSRHADGRKWSFPDLIEEAKKAEGFSSVVDANDKSFLAPDSMIDAIRVYCEKTGQPAPQSVGEIMQCVYRSLAICYRDAIHALEQLTGKTLTSINIVGGGCQDNYLNAITAKMTGLPVYAGPIEGTAIGNLLVQMIAGGELKDLQEARDAIRRSFAVREIQPGQNG